VGALDVGALDVGALDVGALDVGALDVGADVVSVDVGADVVSVDAGADVVSVGAGVDVVSVDVGAVDVDELTVGSGEQVAVEVAVGGTVVEVGGIGEGPTTVVRGFGTIRIIGVKPGWRGAVFTARLAAARLEPAEPVGAVLEAGKAEAGRAVTPWRYASAMAVTVLA
jgi:hypothetical protein